MIFLFFGLKSITLFKIQTSRSARKILFILNTNEFLNFGVAERGESHVLFLHSMRRGGRAVEGARLEIVYTGDRIEGSNPSLSAIRFVTYLSNQSLLWSF